MKGRTALAFVVPAFAAIFAIAVGAGFLMGQSSFRPTLPPPGLTMPSAPSSGTTAPSGPESSPSSAPSTSTAPPADQPGGGESPPSGSPPSPAPAAGASGDTQQIPVPSPSPTGPPLAGGPTAVPPIPGPPSRFHVQAGSFTDRDGAVALVRQLRDRGYAVTLVEGPPYRIWVGGYLDRATAERLAANLQAEGFETSLTPR
jgi:cell division septation protein DedD